MTSPNNTFVIPGYNGLYITPDGTLKSWYHAILYGKMVESDNTVRTLGTGYRAITNNYLLKEDGTLWHFWDGEVDAATKIMDNVKQISGGTVLKNDGTVWSTVPQTKDIPTADKFQYITSGGKQVFGASQTGITEYAYVVKEDGSLWSWGSNESYLLGRNVTGEWGSLGKVMDNVAYATGGMAIKTDGTLWSWGINGNGQVGNGGDSTVYTPVKIMDRVAGAWSFDASAGRAACRFAVTMDGELYSWGSNSGWNPLGYEGGNDGYTAWGFGTIAYQTVPRKVGVSQVVSVYSTGQTTAILKKDGSLWAYGRNIDLPITKDEAGLEALTTFTKFLDGVKLPASASGTSTIPTTPTTTTTPTTPTTTQQPTGTANPFTDVPEGSYYHDAVLWALENNITNGVTSTQFQPNATCTRGQVVTFLWRAKGCPEPATKVNPFKDVSSTSPFYKAILWAYENNITTGTTATTFNPGGTCTSAHVVTFLWRANGQPAAPGYSALASTYSGQYYTSAVAWADSSSLLSGTGKTFVPGAQSPRADIVTYLYRELAA